MEMKNDSTKNEEKLLKNEHVSQKQHGRAQNNWHAPDDVTERCILQTEIDLTGTTGEFKIFREKEKERAT